jgi:hypothetical protein
MDQYYYPATMQKVCDALLDLFDNITVKKYSGSTVVKSLTVPVMFGTVDPPQAYREENESGMHFYQSLPRIAISMASMARSQERSRSENEERFWLDGALSAANSLYEDLQPVPYDYSFSVAIRCNTMQEMAQILENVLPYFNPTLALRVKEFSFLNIERDLITRLEGVNLEFATEVAKEGERSLETVLDIVVEGFVYRPVTSAAIMKVLKTRFFIGDSTLNYQVSEYQTSAYPATSAGEAPPYAPTTGFMYSAYDSENEVYRYTSADSFD